MRLGWASGISFLCICSLVEGQDWVDLIRVWDECAYYAKEQAPPADWFLPEFEGRDWTYGAPAFGPSYPAPTPVSGLGTAIPSLYVRKRFLVSHPEAIRHLYFRIDWSGGFVVYLNGRRVLVQNLPLLSSDPLPHTIQPIEPHWSGTAEVFDLGSGSELLQPGTNLFALHWVPGNGYGSSCTLELLGNFVRGPCLQGAGIGYQIITWKTKQPTDTRIEYGLTPELGEVIEDKEPVTLHAVRLNHLIPGRRYFYRVGYTEDGQRVDSPIYSFSAFPTNGTLRFAVLADLGSGNRNQFAIAKVLAATQPDFVLMPGDLVYSVFRPSLADFRLFSVYARLFHTTPFFAVAGNHDVMYGARGFFDAIFPPTNDLPAEVHAQWQTGPKHFYSFDFGPVHFVGLYAPLGGTPGGLEPDSPQLAWLEQDLASTSKPWKVLFLHQPLRTSGMHQREDHNFNGRPDPEDVSAVLLPIARRYGVQLIFSAHDHDYERFSPIDGIQLFVTGGGGGMLYSQYTQDPFSVHFLRQHHFLLVEGDTDKMQITALGKQGEVLDRVWIRRTLPPTPVMRSTWHTVSFPTQASPDEDGNFPGQIFDFHGCPFLGVPGQESNPGRLWINEDKEFLYLGLESIVPGPGGLPILFVEIPGRPGLTDLKALEPISPDSFDESSLAALRVLRQLRFQNFQPSVAVVLGDEFADQTDPDWPAEVQCETSPGNWETYTVRIGQGAFFLTPTLSPIEGARIQQFNRSPQTEPDPGERTVDFAVVALPRSALGISYGQSIRIGLVILRPRWRLEDSTWVGWLDRAFVGANLEGGGWEPTFLRPISVQLMAGPDTDEDGLPDADELARGLDPNRPDTDGDGLPDGWELRNGLDPTDPNSLEGAKGDPDHDGLPNLSEYRLGIDPQDPQSTLRLQWELTEGYTGFLSWQNPPYAVAALEWTPRLSPSTRWWILYDRGCPNQTVRLPIQTLPSGFYRLRVSP